MTQRRLYKILDFPKHLQTTILTLIKVGSATASELSAITGKQRAVECAYLNQLVVCKWFAKNAKIAKLFSQSIWRLWIGKRQTLGQQRREATSPAN